MATVNLNSITKGISGSIGNLMFRQTHGTTIVSGKPRPAKKQSELQRENRSRFKLATYWAKAQMHDPEKKAYYWRKARKLKLPNAYTAAICDYMRKGEVKQINTHGYRGKAGDVIHIETRRKDFAVRKVDVTLRKQNGELIETGTAIRKDNGVFIYKASQTPGTNTRVIFSIKLNGHEWNAIQAEKNLSQ